MTALSKRAVGLARSLPAISGAVPCTYHTQKTRIMINEMINDHSIEMLLHQPPVSNTYRFKYGNTIGSDVPAGSDSKASNQSGTQITERQVKGWKDFKDNQITLSIII